MDRRQKVRARLNRVKFAQVKNKSLQKLLDSINNNDLTSIRTQIDLFYQKIHTTRVAYKVKRQFFQIVSLNGIEYAFEQAVQNRILNDDILSDCWTNLVNGHHIRCFRNLFDTFGGQIPFATLVALIEHDYVDMFDRIFPHCHALLTRGEHENLVSTAFQHANTKVVSRILGLLPIRSNFILNILHDVINEQRPKYLPLVKWTIVHGYIDHLDCMELYRYAICTRRFNTLNELHEVYPLLPNNSTTLDVCELITDTIWNEDYCDLHISFLLEKYHSFGLDWETILIACVSNGKLEIFKTAFQLMTTAEKNNLFWNIWREVIEQEEIDMWITLMQDDVFDGECVEDDIPMGTLTHFKYVFRTYTDLPIAKMKKCLFYHRFMEWISMRIIEQQFDEDDLFVLGRDPEYSRYVLEKCRKMEIVQEINQLGDIPPNKSHFFPFGGPGFKEAMEELLNIQKTI